MQRIDFHFCFLDIVCKTLGFLYNTSDILYIPPFPFPTPPPRGDNKKVQTRVIAATLGVWRKRHFVIVPLWGRVGTWRRLWYREEKRQMEGVPFHVHRIFHARAFQTLRMARRHILGLSGVTDLLASWWIERDEKLFPRSNIELVYVKRERSAASCEASHFSLSWLKVTG